MASSGNAIAMATIRTAAAREIAMRGEDSSTTGNKVMLAIAHNDTTFCSVATAKSAGSSSGSMNTSAASRRGTSSGHSMSAIVARSGFATKAVSRIGRRRSQARHPRAEARKQGLRNRPRMGFKRIAERHELVEIEPCDMRRQRHGAGRDGHIGRRERQISAATLVDQRRDGQRGQQHHGPVFADHGAGGRDTGEHRETDAAAFERPQKEPRGQRPPRHHGGIGVVLERVKIEERHQSQQRQADGVLRSVKITQRGHEGDPQRDGGRHQGEQIIRPRRERKNLEPGAGDQAGSGGCLGVPNVTSRDHATISPMSKWMSWLPFATPRRASRPRSRPPAPRRWCVPGGQDRRAPPTGV